MVTDGNASIENGPGRFQTPALAVGTQIQPLILELLPEPFSKHVVVAALSPRPTDLAPLGLQPGQTGVCGEVSALIGVEDHWSASTAEAHLQSLQP